MQNNNTNINTNDSLLLSLLRAETRPQAITKFESSLLTWFNAYFKEFDNNNILMLLKQTMVFTDINEFGRSVYIDDLFFSDNTTRIIEHTISINFFSSLDFTDLMSYDHAALEIVDAFYSNVSFENIILKPKRLETNLAVFENLVTDYNFAVFEPQNSINFLLPSPGFHMISNNFKILDVNHDNSNTALFEKNKFPNEPYQAHRYVLNKLVNSNMPNHLSPDAIVPLFMENFYFMQRNQSRFNAPKSRFVMKKKRAARPSSKLYSFFVNKKTVGIPRIKILNKSLTA